MDSKTPEFSYWDFAQKKPLTINDVNVDEIYVLTSLGQSPIRVRVTSIDKTKNEVTVDPPIPGGRNQDTFNIATNTSFALYNLPSKGGKRRRTNRRRKTRRDKRKTRRYRRKSNRRN
jgi:hypothetical protein